MSTSNDDYVGDYLPPSIVEKLEAAAFRSLCSHLRERSDEVQNLDLMTISGFCRNCLAKWMVLGCRDLSRELEGQKSKSEKDEDEDEDEDDDDELDYIIRALDAMGYDEAARYVYGQDYKEWKKAHSKKASDEQMRLYHESEPLHAKHDKDLLTTIAVRPTEPRPKPKPKRRDDDGDDDDDDDDDGNNDEQRTKTRQGDDETSSSPRLLSNVCCTDIEQQQQQEEEKTQTQMQPQQQQQQQQTQMGQKTTTDDDGKKKTRSIPPYVPPGAPKGGIDVTIQIVTVSDRAYRHEYETGDLSGPAVRDAITKVVDHMMLHRTTNNPVVCRFPTKDPIIVVPDETKIIRETLLRIVSSGKKEEEEERRREEPKQGVDGKDDDHDHDDDDDKNVDIIFTTGGTGFGPRDVTPEATKDVLDRECRGLMGFVLTEVSRMQPLSSLSRGTAGVMVRGKDENDGGHGGAAAAATTFVANLPGNPVAVDEIMPLLLPLVLRAVEDIRVSPRSDFGGG